MSAKHLGDGQHQVGGGDSGSQLAGEFHSNDRRCEHEDGLAEHAGLRLDAAHAPAEDAETVDHRRVRVRADERVEVRQAISAVLRVRRPDGLAEILEVHLMADAACRRHHREVLEGELTPAEELVALAISLELHIGVELDRVHAIEEVDLDGVVDDKIHGELGVDACRITAELIHGAPHRRQIDDTWHAGEILQQHARRLERQLSLRRLCRVVCGELLYVLRGYLATVLVSHHRLEKYADGERHPVNAGETRVRKFGQTEVVEGLALALECRTCTEGIGVCGHAASLLIHACVT